MKKYLMLGMMLLLMVLTVGGCKKKGETRIDDLTLVTPSGAEIYLYMPREDVEELLGEGDKSSVSNSYYYDDITIMIDYKDGVVGQIFVSEVGYKTKSGIEIGEPFTLTGYQESDDMYMKTYIKKNGGLIEFDPDKDKNLDNTAFVIAFIEDGSVSDLSIYDMTWLLENDFDE